MLEAAPERFAHVAKGRSRIFSALTLVAGIDGIPGGWIYVSFDVDSCNINNISFISTLSELFSFAAMPAVVGIDIPIGLLDSPRRGGRDCDRAARKLLGAPRQSSVFPPPVRSALNATTHAEASLLNAGSGDALGLSRQSFAIMPKIREADSFISIERQNWLKEVHPEVSFAMMADGACQHRKSSALGWNERRKRLSAAGLPDPLAVMQRFGLRWGLRADLADAMAAAWSASRVLRECAVILPSAQPPIDSRGLRMEIVA